jgi:hypothetical protein
VEWGKKVIAIPQQLSDPSFRFVRLGRKSKIPIKGESQSNNPRTYSEIEDHIKKENYGVIAGLGGLVIVDSDSEESTLTIEQDLPETFTVTSSKPYKRHYYFIATGQLPTEKSLSCVNPDNRKENWATIRIANSYVVGPGSTHPDGAIYTVSNNVPIQNIPWCKIGQTLARFIVSPPKPIKRFVHRQIREDKGIPILNILNKNNIALRRIGRELCAPHPIHGSDNGHNLCIDEEKNAWCCRRCLSGGGPTSLIAVLEGIIDCSKARKGGLIGQLFKQTKEIERRKYV